MRIIISPAKKMRTDNDIPFRRLPLFLSDARKIVAELKKRNVEELMALYRSNESIAVQNFER
ncbi:MAG: peroxide stress protein YaaA, partial [Bacillota bacterium]|nr:peroxide stress protein YaaA [Bacillota bacterium]